MKELELTLKIQQIDGLERPYGVLVIDKKTMRYPACFTGKTLEEAMGKFCESITEGDLRQWFGL